MFGLHSKKGVEKGNNLGGTAKIVVNHNWVVSHMPHGGLQVSEEEEESLGEENKDEEECLREPNPIESALYRYKPDNPTHWFDQVGLDNSSDSVLRNVTHLDLSGNKLGDLGVAQLAYLLSMTNCPVVCLDLGYNQITAQGIDALVAFMVDSNLVEQLEAGESMVYGAAPQQPMVAAAVALTAVASLRGTNSKKNIKKQEGGTKPTLVLDETNETSTLTKPVHRTTAHRRPSLAAQIQAGEVAVPGGGGGDLAVQQQQPQLPIFGDTPPLQPLIDNAPPPLAAFETSAYRSANKTPTPPPHATSYADRCQLHTLRLAWNDLEDEGAIAITKLLFLRTLVELHLGYNDIGPDGGEGLREYIRHSNSLRRLCLGGNKVPQSIIDSIEAVLLYNDKQNVVE